MDGNGLRFQEEDVEVDIMECGNPIDEFQGEEEVSCQVSSSSSFGDSMCDLSFGDGEDEAQSMLSQDYPLPDGEDEAGLMLGLTKKKLTDRWRRFSMSLAWRCKWLELKVKEIESQARGYEKELEGYYGTKVFDLGKSKFEGLEGKLIPFRHRTRRMKAFKRGRRKRFEETTDVHAYRANHNIFSYADKRMPVALKPQFLDLDFGRGCKATCKEGGTEDDCLASELDFSDDFLAKILCKIDEAQEKARTLKKRIDPLMWEFQSDLIVQNGKQLSMPHTEAHNQRVAEQIRRQHPPPDTEDMLRPQTPPFQIGGQCLNNKSPVSSGCLFDTLLDDLLMDETDMNDDGAGINDEKLHYFKKLMNEITGSQEEADAEEDPTPVTKRRKTSR